MKAITNSRTLIHMRDTKHIMTKNAKHRVDMKERRKALIPSMLQFCANGAT